MTPPVTSNPKAGSGKSADVLAVDDALVDVLTDKRSSAAHSAETIDSHLRFPAPEAAPARD